MRDLFLVEEVELYTRAWDNLLNTSAETLVTLLASSVTLLNPSVSFDPDRAEAFLRQYPPQPPPVQEAAQKRTKPSSFQFADVHYDRGIDEKAIKHWKGCWLKFCYVLKDTLILDNNPKKFDEVVWYRNPLSSPFDYKPRWLAYELIEGTNIVVHTGMDSKSIKKEMIVLARHFGYDPPIIKTVGKVQNVKLNST